jgi:hypothetical protein
MTGFGVARPMARLIRNRMNQTLLFSLVFTNLAMVLYTIGVRDEKRIMVFHRFSIFVWNIRMIPKTGGMRSWGFMITQPINRC